MANDNAIEELLKENVHYTKKQDALLDIHVGNPLRRITTLLEEIKKQKAFSFTLTGSLGVMGVVLLFGTFGLLGGNKIICDKGIQTKSGTLSALAYKENQNPTILDLIPFLSDYLYKPLVPRKILTLKNGSIIHVVSSDRFDLTPYFSQQVLITGNFDSCSETITLTDTTGIQSANE